MLRYLVQTVKRDISTNPKLVISLLCIAGAGLIAAVIIICVVLYVPDAPDATTGDLAAIEDYLKSEEFLDLSLADRTAYTKALVKRFEKMSPEEKKQLNGFMRRLAKSNSKVAKDVRNGWTIEQLKRFNSPTDQQRVAKIKATIGIMEAVKGRRNMKRQYSKIVGRTPEEKTKIAREIMTRASNVTHQTTIEERRELMKTVRDINKELRNRYGEQ